MSSSLKLLTAGLLATTVLTVPSIVLAQASPATASPPPTGAGRAESGVSQVEEIEVRGRFIPNEKRETSEIANVLTAESIARAGDSDIAGALTRVTGLSLVGDGYVYVRGLGERYSSALLDGSVLPSPEPLRRVVSLDIFPTSMLSGTLVQKTYSVEYPAEFGGGLIAMRTRAVPEQPFFEIAISGGYNSQATGKRGNFADYGGGAWTGFGGGNLAFPAALKNNPTLEGLTTVQRQGAGRSLRNNWSFDRETIAPDAGIRVAGGRDFEIGDMRAGLLAVVDYSSQFRLREGPRRIFSTSNAGLEVNEDLSPAGCVAANPSIDPESCGVFRTNWDVRLNMLGAAGLEITPDHSLKLTSMILRKTVQEARVERGSFQESPGTIMSRQLSNFIEQQVWTNQLSGEHRFQLPGAFDQLQVNWRGAYSKANRDTPYRREFSYVADSQGRFRWDLAQGRNATIFSALEDESIELGLDGKLSGQIAGREAVIKFGGVTIDKDRDFLQRRYQFNLLQNIGCGTIPDATLQMAPEIILSPDNLGSTCGFAIANSADNSDQFSAKMGVDALYASIDYQILDSVRWTVGVRGERSTQEINTFQQGPVGTPLRPVNVQLDAKYALPATTLTWEFADGLQARVGFSQTLARPDLRELAPSQFYDVDTGATESGNPNLRITRINNFDARVEWYFGERRSATIGAFYKDLTDPIERTYYFTGEGPTRSLANAESAKLKGVEAEFDVALPLEDWLGDSRFITDRSFYLIANVTYVDTEVVRGLADFPNVTQARGPLQGQSKYVGNIQFGYDRPDAYEKMALSFNYQSKRIFGVGIQGIPNTMETPPLLLDFNASKGFEVWGGQVVQFGLKVNNILGREFKTTQGGEISELYKLGRTVSLSASTTF